jgi:hypothetical protein
MSNNTKYSASRVFTKNDLITIKKLLREDKSPKEMNQYLASKGNSDVPLSNNFLKNSSSI